MYNSIHDDQESHNDNSKAFDVKRNYALEDLGRKGDLASSLKGAGLLGLFCTTALHIYSPYIMLTSFFMTAAGSICKGLVNRKTRKIQQQNAQASQARAAELTIISSKTFKNDRQHAHCPN